VTGVPAFPPSIARRLKEPAGSVEFHYTAPAGLERRRPFDRVLMETPYDEVLVALVLDTKDCLRFIRTGSKAECARVARTPADAVLGHRHWLVELEWDPDRIEVRARTGEP
jgi:hypothetical protein